MEIKEKYGLKFEPARIIEGDALELKNMEGMEEKFDACITSPPYYFSIDYVGKDRIAYDYLGVDMKKIESKYLGMRNNEPVKGSYGGLPPRVAIKNIFWALKPGGKLAIIIGDSTVNGKKIPTTMTTKRFCEED
ncbi:MAG: hypothetical protein ABIN73_09710 [candidate division WOR-3 bacterium]